MGFEARIIEALQRASNVVLDYLFYALTFMGDKLFFIMVASVIYWCFSKKFGFRFINIYIFSAAGTEILKSIFKRPRPFNAYASIRSIFAKTSGYSFPSGHTISIAGMSTLISLKAYKEGKHFKLALIVSIIATSLVMLSRMYLGQHFLSDVVAGAIVGFGLAVLLGYAYDLLVDSEFRFWLVVLPVSVVLLIIMILSGNASADSRIIQSLGAYAAVCLGYKLESIKVCYEVRSGNIIKQIAKASLGIVSSLFIMLSLRWLLALAVDPESALGAIGAYLSYFLLGLHIMLVCPLIFKALKI